MEKIINKVFKSVWKEFVYGGHLLSLGLTGIVWSFIIILGLPLNWQILLISYLIPQIVYTYNHFKETKEDFLTNPERTKYLQKVEKYFPFVFSLYFLLLILLLLSTNINTFLFVLFLSLGGVLYSIHLKKLTQKIFCFKNIYTSLFWAMGGAFFPIFYYSISFNITFFLFFLFIFFRWILNTIFFDIKDMEGDRKENLKTMPSLIGKEKTLQFLHILNFLSMIPVVLGAYFKILPFFSLFLVIFYFYSYYYLKVSKRADNKKIRSLSYLMVDGEYILWLPVLLLGKELIF